MGFKKPLRHEGGTSFRRKPFVVFGMFSHDAKRNRLRTTTLRPFGIFPILVCVKTLSEHIRGLCNEKGELSATLSELNDRLKEQSLGIFIILLAFPSALPIPAAGYSTPFGIVLMWIGFLFIRGKRQLQLPKKWLDKRFKLPAKMVAAILKYVVIFEKVVHPNRAAKLCRILNYRWVGVNIVLLAFVMALPIPLTNTIPAGVILWFGLGLLENDGLVLLAAQACSAVLIALYATAAFWVATFGLESLQRILRAVHLMS